MRDVFISHAPSDGKVAATIAAFLEQEKIACWFAARDLAAGDDVEEMTRAVIASCPVAVLIFSREANQSPEVHEQVERVLQAEKILIPLRIENVAPTGPMESLLRHRFRHDAFAGPLERHLPELVRMLRPLLHRLVVKTREATSISRTLPSRSSIVRGPDERKTGALPQPGVLAELALHFPHPVFAGHPSVVEVRMQTRSTTFNGTVRITLQSLGLKKPVTLELKKFSQGEHRQQLALTPGRSGVFPLHVTVILDDANKRLQLRGVRDLRINQERPVTDLVRPEEVMVNHATADLFLAQPARDAEAALPVSDLLAVEVPENFEPLDLEPDFEVGQWALESLKPAGPLEIPAGFTDKGQFGTLLRLEPETASPDLPFQEIRLVARPGFAVGRSREDCDYLAWFWPRNDVHDTKTRRISKKHGTFAREGAAIAVRNVAAGSLTTFDGQDLTASDTLTFQGMGTLNLSGIYELAVVRFPSTLDADDSDMRPGAVGFVSRTPNTLPQHALWLGSDGSFGSSAVNPLRLELPGLAEVQGRFHYDQGLFWIESVIDNGAVEVEGLTLKRGWVVPLAHGLKVRLGDASFTVALEV
jgi:hypothetical protein